MLKNQLPDKGRWSRAGIYMRVTRFFLAITTFALCFDNTALAQCPPGAPTGTNCYTQINPFYCQTNVQSLIHINNTADVLAKRHGLVQAIWGSQSFPINKLPLGQDIQSNIPSPLSGLPNLRRVDKIVTRMNAPPNSGTAQLKSVIYYFQPVTSNNRLMIFHQGHESRPNPLAQNGGQDTIAYFLSQGYSVLAFQMPLYGDNADASFPGASHDVLGQFKTAELNPLKYFLEPIAVALNYMTRMYVFSHISMIGISGGGWTTILYAAIDPRVQISIPVAGSLPFYLRAKPPGAEACAEGPGDWEQDEINQLIDYTELYVLGAYGSRRRQIQVINQFDSCCFWGIRYQTYEQTVKNVVSSLGSGTFEVLLDSSHQDHKISTNVLNAVGMELNNTDLRPHKVPGGIQAEDFDAGGEGVAYHDNTPGNVGGAYRATDVDLYGPTSDAGGGAVVGDITAGEWLKYTVSVTESGTYTIQARVSAVGTGGSFHIEIDGANVTGSMAVPNTGNWDSYATISKAGVSLSAGQHAVRVVMDTAGTSGYVCGLNHITITH